MSENLPGDTAELLARFVPGSRVAGYLLVEQIGAGGMAAVYRARDERLGRVVALKILAPQLASDQRFRQRFIRESRAAAAVDDPHIVPVHEAGDAQGVLFIAMRYVPGGSVADLLHRDGPLSPERVAAIISPMASALDAAHAAGLVHRDVKPANMLIDIRPDRPDHVYLSDFGLTKDSATSIGLTGSDQVLGTPSYMAPEQIQGLTVDGRTDQYALACAAFEMLTGEVPFRRDQGLAVMWAHFAQPPPAASSRRPDLGESVDQVFMKALAKVPHDRYPVCRDFADALRESLCLTPYHAPINVVRPEANPNAAKSRPTSAASSYVARPGPDIDSGDTSGSTIRTPPEREIRSDIDHLTPESFNADETQPRLVVGAEASLPSSQQRAPTAVPVSGAEISILPEFDNSQSEVPHSKGRPKRGRLVVIVLGALLLLAVGGLIVGYQVVRSQYYVADDSGKVAIFRGVPDDVLGISLFSVYQTTNIPASGITAAAAAELRRGDTGSLAMAQQFVANIRAQYDICQTAEGDLRDWLAHKPKPVKVKTLVNGRPVTRVVTPKYRPKPAIPSFCPS